MSKKMMKKLERKVKKKLESSTSCHDIGHTLRVLNNAMKIAENINNIELNVIKCAALLHDYARAEEMASDGKECHAKIGSKLALEVMIKCGFDERTSKHVSECVKTHRYRDKKHPKTLEAKIIYDADKLDSLGAIGIGRAFLFAGRFGAKLHNSYDEAINSKEYSKDDTAYREYLVKLSKLPNKMLTIEGKKIAIERHDFMKTFFEKLSEEYFG